MKIINIIAFIIICFQLIVTILITGHVTFVTNIICPFLILVLMYCIYNNKR